MTTKLAKRLMGFLGVAVVLGVLVGCGGGDFTVSLQPTTTTIAQGKSGTVAVNLARTGGFKGEVTFAVTGLPSGVTAKFDPEKTTADKTTLTLTVGSTVPTQKYSLKVTATSGKLKKEAVLELTVAVAPDFTLEAAPASVAVKQGATATVTVNIKRTATMTEAVALTLEGAPAGVTGTFNPASAPADKSTLTLQVAATTAPGNYTLTVRGKGGGLDKTAKLTLTVEAVPDFSMSLTPAAVTVKQGATGTVTVNITRVGGFADVVLLEAEGAPAGVRVSFDPNPAPAGVSTITLAVDATAAVGSYTLTVRGTGGTITKTARLTLTVAAP
ncbi:hypothetical protein H5T53_01985 [Candidatus Bipolaricaulota bacterium]|nr:hypothetical protein [Candidatus Bipolaricaulota bacterium]